MAPHASFGEGLPPELFFTLLTTPSVVRYARTPTGSSSFSTGRALTRQRSSPVRLGSNSRSPPARYYHTPILCIFSFPSFLASLLFTSYSSVLLPCPTHSTFLTPSPWLPRLLKSGGRRFVSFYVYPTISGSFDCPRRTEISRLHLWILTQEKRMKFCRSDERFINLSFIVCRIAHTSQALFAPINGRIAQLVTFA